MSGRRRRDGRPNQDNGAPAVGPRSISASRGRKRADPQADAGDGDAPRVRGAWTTPAVVVRRPDGSVVNDDERGTAPARASRPGRAPASRPGAGAEAPTKGRKPRLRPRRIPGAPGAVLLTPTLSDAAGGARGASPAPQRRGDGCGHTAATAAVAEGGRAGRG